MRKLALSVKVVVFLILFILPCVSIASEKPEIFVQLGHGSSVNAVAFSTDGRYVVSGSDDKTLKLWELATGKERRNKKGTWVEVDHEAERQTEKGERE